MGRLSMWTRRLTMAMLVAAMAVAMAPSWAWAADLPQFDGDVRVMLVDENTGEVVLEQGADEQAYPASLTKMMTALVAYDIVGDQLDAYVEAGEEVALTPEDSTVMGVHQGDSFTWRDLLHGMLIPSGTDAALVIGTQAGRIAAGNDELSVDDALATFVDLMNAKAEEMGLTGTHFANVHGFHDDNHYSTARDLARIAQAVRANELLRSITSSSSYSCTSAEGSELTFYSTNWLIDQTAADIDEDGILEDEGLPGVDNPYFRANCSGIKTGYTYNAGRCLAIACEGPQLSLVGVALGMLDQPTMYTQMGAVCDAVQTMERRTWQETIDPQSIAVSNASLVDRLHGAGTVVAQPQEQVSEIIDSSRSYETRISWDPTYVQLEADGSAKLATVVSEGARVGSVEILRDGEVLHSVPLVSTVALTPFGNRDVTILVVVGIVALLILVIVVSMIVAGGKRRARRRRSGGRGGNGRGGSGKSAKRRPQARQQAGAQRGASQTGVPRAAQGGAPRSPQAEARSPQAGPQTQQTPQAPQGGKHRRPSHMR